MKTTAPPKWYIEWDKELRRYKVLKDGFCDSTHYQKIFALERLVELEELEIDDELS